MNIDTLNAHGGFGFNPEPRPSEGRRTINVVGARSVFVLRRPGPFRGRRRSPACLCGFACSWRHTNWPARRPPPWPQVHASPLGPHQKSSSSPPPPPRCADIASAPSPSNAAGLGSRSSQRACPHGDSPFDRTLRVSILRPGALAMLVAIGHRVAAYVREDCTSFISDLRSDETTR